MSPSSAAPGGLFPLLSFYWQGGGLLQGSSVLSVTERLGRDKGTEAGSRLERTDRPWRDAQAEA